MTIEIPWRKEQSQFMFPPGNEWKMKSARTKANSILLKGSYGRGNLGDESLLWTISREIRSVLPSCRLSALYYSQGHNDLFSDINLISLNSASRLAYRPLTLLTQLISHDILAFGGGAQVNLGREAELRNIYRLCRTAKLLGKSVWFLHVGIDGKGSEKAQTILKAILQASDIFSVRDRVSWRIAESVVPGKAIRTADPALLLSPRLKADVRKPISKGIAFICRKYEGVEVQVAKILCEVCSQLNVPLALMCTADADIPVAATIYEHMLPQMSHPGLLELKPFSQDFLRVVEDIGSYDLVVTMTLHGGVFSALSKRNLIAVGNLDHMVPTLTDIGYPDGIAIPKGKLSLMRNVIVDCLTNRLHLIPDREQLELARDRIKRFYTGLSSWLGAATPSRGGT